jgi:hypothetical protein
MMMFALALVLAPYIGTTIHGGDYDHGSVFIGEKGRRSPPIYSFCSRGDGYCYDGANPVANLLQLPDGTIVGTSTEGGSGAGTIFRLHFTTDKGVQYEHIWDVCWTYSVCDLYGVPEGTLQLVGTTKDGDPIIEGTCEAEDGRGVYYRLTLTKEHGNAIIPLDYWGKHGGVRDAPPPVAVMP